MSMRYDDPRLDGKHCETCSCGSRFDRAAAIDEIKRLAPGHSFDVSRSDAYLEALLGALRRSSAQDTREDELGRAHEQTQESRKKMIERNQNVWKEKLP
jgi:hypothetical protein